MMADSQEKPVDGDIKNLTILPLEPCSRNSRGISKDLTGVAVPENLYVGGVPDLSCIAREALKTSRRTII